MSDDSDKITAVRYAFCSAALSAPGIESHQAFARQALQNLFKLAPSAVVVQASPRLPEDAPFTLTCYAGKRTCVVAMVLAARQVLPHLNRTEPGKGWSASMVPGIDMDLDLDELSRLSEGKRQATAYEAEWIRAALHELKLPHAVHLETNECAHILLTTLLNP